MTLTSGTKLGRQGYNLKSVLAAWAGCIVLMTRVSDLNAAIKVLTEMLTRLRVA